MGWRRACLIGLAACGIVSLAYAAEPAQPNKSASSTEANKAIDRMGRTLAQENIAFKARTIRVYQDPDGDYLHIVHNMNIEVRRPDHIAVTAAGDDGTTKLVYDGKQVSILDAADNKYVQVPTTGNLQEMFDEISQRVGVEFPLADLVSDDPAKSFLAGVIGGKEVGTDKVDGVPCRHLFFTQSGATELELWLENNERAIPHRLIITHRALPGTPNLIAEFSDWNFQNRPVDAQFAFQPPAGATKVDVATIGSGARSGNSTPSSRGNQ